jgi:glucan phosphoethanolaminetransferase (alkaline phosphatase superfamily)
MSAAQTSELQKQPTGLYILGALRVAPLIALTFWASRDQGSRSVITVLLTGFLEIYLIAALTRTWRFFFVVSFPLFLLGLLYATYTILYGTPPGRSLAFILLTTSPEEVIGFLSLPQTRVPAVVFGLLCVLYVCLTWRLPATLRIRPIGAVARASRWATFAPLLLITAYAAWNADQLIDGAAYEPTVGSVMFFAGTVPKAQAVLQGGEVAKVPYKGHRAGGEEVHIFVLGESARRDSWAVYGYNRLTTPYLNTLKSEAIFLQAATADANVTTWAVPVLLTGMTPQQVATVAIRGNILDLAKEAGYSTAWLLNQDITISAGVGIAADRTVYPPDFKANILDRHTLDEALLPAYRRELERTGHARFIGIHMMGSHWEYYRRYPPAFRRFGSGDSLSTISIFVQAKKIESNVVDTYDNTVLYTDWFLQQIIEPARQLTAPVTITYFPDHGEDLQLLDGNSGHGAPYFTPHAFAIPAFVWVNEAYRKAHPGKVAALYGNAAKAIRSHDLFATLADLMGISWPSQQAVRSFASKEFKPDPEAKFSAGGVLISHPLLPLPASRD